MCNTKCNTQHLFCPYYTLSLIWTQHGIMVNKVSFIDERTFGLLEDGMNKAHHLCSETFPQKPTVNVIITSEEWFTGGFICHNSLFGAAMPAEKQSYSAMGKTRISSQRHFLLFLAVQTFV